MGQMKPPTYYWRWTVPLNNAQMELGALGKLQLRSRGANGRPHTRFLSPVPSSKWDTWFGGSRWWHCELAWNNSTQHLMIQHRPKQEEPSDDIKSAQTRRRRKSMFQRPTASLVGATKGIWI